MSDLRYRREIDGLRAVAVLPVMLFHAGFPAFGGGFVGVDVFFVISGYLITSLILNDLRQERFSLARFYERRARRILPALFFVMAACIPLAWWILLPHDLKVFAKDMLGVVSFSSNIFFWLDSGYFDAPAELKPLLHTWSLAVEEQFYIIFPPFFFVLWRTARRFVVPVFAGFAVVSLVAAEIGTQFHMTSPFYLLPMRSWELTIGSLIVVTEEDRIRLAAPWREALGILGAAMLAASVVLLDRATPFPGISALPPTVGAALLIVFATPDTMMGRLLGNRVLVGVGLISYSAYLWHHPLLAFARYRYADLDTTALLALLALSGALAWFSWRFVETPFRTPNRISRRGLVLACSGAAVFFAAVGTAGLTTRGFERHYVASRLSPEEAGIYRLLKRHVSANMLPDMVDDGACTFWRDRVDEKFEARFARCAARMGNATIILGDSHAMNVFNFFARATRGQFIVGISRGGCRPYDGNQTCHYEAFERFATTHHAQIATVYYHQSGSYFLRDHVGRLDSREAFISGRGYSIDGRAIDALVAWLKRLAQAVPVVWIGPFAEARVDFNDIRGFRLRGFAMNAVSLTAFGELEPALKARAAQAGLPYVSLHDILGLGRDSLKIGDCITFRDIDHVSVCGEAIFGRKLIDALDARQGSPRISSQP